MTQTFTPVLNTQTPPVSRVLSLVDTVSNYTTVTTAGYLNPIVALGHPVTAYDFIMINYSGGQGCFVPSIDANGIVTLAVITNPTSVPGHSAWVDVVAGHTALASAGKVNVQVSSGSQQYAVRNLFVNYSASGLSGSSGDRLLVLTDGTTVYNNAGITAALLGTPVNTVWGGSGNPLAGTVAQNTPTAAGANLYFQYSGGTIDYSAGSVSLTVLVQRLV